jgi:hypothetical protein
MVINSIMTDPDRDKWEQSDLRMAREQAFEPGGNETIDIDVDIVREALRFQSLTEGLDLDLTDPKVVAALRYTANIIANSKNQDSPEFL